MNELVDRIVANLGIDRTVAERAVAIILDFLLKEGPADRVQSLVDQLPGAREAIAAESGKGGGGLAGMFGMGGGLMAVGGRLMAAGLGMSEIQAVTRELIAFGRERAGDDAMNAIIGAIPGLDQYI